MLILIPVSRAKLTATDVETCEACWRQPVAVIRRAPGVRDLLCDTCATEGNPVRVELFPPLGIYRLTQRRLDAGKHSKPTPQLPPAQGPHPPRPTPTLTPGVPPI
ncbi:hypothetical protein ACH41E_24475 [Streptomyces sp. NPDC020412]|uniref:hypothetical protein n=1 Tax=Streptomyces sp. NPDC020412 TaxID=3365073 RepID=UPI003789692E